MPLLLDGWADWDVDAVRDDARDYPVELLDTLAGAQLAADGTSRCGARRLARTGRDVLDVLSVRRDVQDGLPDLRAPDTARGCDGLSYPCGTITGVRHGAVRVRLDVTDVQAGMLLRAAGARRSRRADRARFTVTDGLHLETGRLRLAKYGWVRLAAPCEAQAKLRRLLRRGHARLLNTSVTRHADGRWYAAICYARELHVPEQHAAPAGSVVGLDRGAKTAAIVATSQREPVAELPAVRALRDALRHVKHLQRDVSRTQKGSANRRKPSPGSAAPTPGPRRCARTRCTPSPRGWPAPTAWSSSRT